MTENFPLHLNKSCSFKIHYHFIEHPVHKYLIISEISPKPRIVYTPNGDQILELTIETLMGTTFEVRLPAKTLVASIKNRFQRSEGVPRHHLHIIHGGKHLHKYIFTKIY